MINDVDELSPGGAGREQAIRRLKKRRDFQTHLLVFTLINGMLVVIWAMTGRHGFFWPIFPILGWGIAVLLNAWDFYRGDTPSEEQIRKEVQRLERRP